MSASALIVSALIAAAASGISAGMQSKSQREAQEEAKRLADIQRGDILGAQKSAEELSKEGLVQRRRESAQQQQQFLANLAAQREEAAMGRRERSEERTYGRRQDVYNNALALLNNDTNLQNRLSSLWGGR